MYSDPTKTLGELLAYVSLASPVHTAKPFKPIIFRQSCSGKLETSKDFKNQAKAAVRRKKAARRKKRGY